MISTLATHEVQMASDKATACLLVFCGLPAAGKTTIARRLVQFLQQRDVGERRVTPAIRVHHVCFDDIEADLIVDSSTETPDSPATFEPTIWKAARERAYTQIEELLQSRQDSSGPPKEGCFLAGEPSGRQTEDSTNTEYHLIIADDNMYYRSMRRSLFLRARTYGAAFVQLYVPMDVTEAVANNKQRPSSVVQVSEATIERMASLIEVPDGDTYSWELNTITTNLATTSEDLWRTTWDTWGQAPCLLPSAEELLKQKEQGTAANDANMMHQLDLHMRKLVSQTMSAALAVAGPSASNQLRASWAKTLNEERRRIMNAVRPLAPSSSHSVCQTDADLAVSVTLFESQVQREEAQFMLLCDYIMSTATT